MSAFLTRSYQIDNGDVLKVQLLKEDTVLSYHSVISLWQQSEAFRTFYIEFLSSIQYTAYRWETPPLNSKTVHRPFEFVIINSPELDVPPDAYSFADYFDDAPAKKDIVTFPNLGKDAWLVVPCPDAPETTYSHLGVFSKLASRHQNHALWQRVGQLVAAHLDDKPRWLNTAGGGVAWLHIRLDNRPKYYCYSPYKTYTES